ncbi:MAG: insulinase family protein, partial [Blastocatellia bacterium]|nr:insulinase family protein [Blastocatellia bacterium]
MCRLFWLLVALFSPSVVLAQAANPFAGFETITLPNNMKLWYKQLKGDQNVSVSVSVPFGSNQDPVGKEQLAHFTEHMLFSDHLGKTEEQIKKEVEDLGGDRNAVTYGDRTFYYVRIDRKHALFAIDWLSRIVSPHEMASSVVEKQRIPVAIEIGAQPRQLFDWISATYINPSFLRFPSFWKRDFNIEVPFIDRDYYPHRSLSAITADDLRNFYNRYYVPSLMTVVVIGDIEREEVLKKVTETFGALASRPVPQTENRLKDASKLRESFQWTYNADIFFSKMFRFYNPSKETYLKGLFVVELLRKRLNERLRFGDKKAAYG